MGFRCRLLGHEFGDTTLERHYEERARGTVLTVREYRSCQRCGIEDEFYSKEGILSPVSDDGDSDGDSEPSGATETAPDRQETVKQPVPKDDDRPEKAIRDANGPRAEASVEDDAIVETEKRGTIAHDSGEPIDGSTTNISTGSSRTTTGPSRPTTGQGMRMGGNANWTTASPETAMDDSADPEPLYRCRECGFEVPAESSPLHEGDICSSCRNGYFEYVRDGYNVGRKSLGGRPHDGVRSDR